MLIAKNVTLNLILIFIEVMFRYVTQKINTEYEKIKKINLIMSIYNPC
jgi:hypothetical protein